jgi:hypothetical protein
MEPLQHPITSFAVVAVAVVVVSFRFESRRQNFPKVSPLYGFALLVICISSVSILTV